MKILLPFFFLFIITEAQVIRDPSSSGSGSVDTLYIFSKDTIHFSSLDTIYIYSYDTVFVNSGGGSSLIGFEGAGNLFLTGRRNQWKVITNSGNDYLSGSLIQNDMIIVPEDGLYFISVTFENVGYRYIEYGIRVNGFFRYRDNNYPSAYTNLTTTLPLDQNDQISFALRSWYGTNTVKNIYGTITKVTQ